MAEIANVASQFINTMPRPMQNLAAGFAQGQQVKQRNRALDMDQERLNMAREQMAMQSRQQQMQMMAGLAMRVKSNPEPQRALEALQRNGVFQGQTLDSLDMVIAAGVKPETLATMQNQQAARQQADRAYGLQERKFAEDTRQFGVTSGETARHNLAMEQKKSGTLLSVDPDTGEMTFAQGDIGSMPLDKVNRRKVEGSTFNLQESHARYRGIEKAYNPNALTLQGKAGNWWRNAKNFALGDEAMSDEEKAQIIEYTRMYRRTAENLSLFIKDISGAAVSAQEAERLSKALPTMDDGPIAYKAKLEDVMDQVKAGLWRHNYALQKGIDPLNSKVSLYDMDSIIESEGKEIELQVRRENPGLPDQEIANIVGQRLRAIFGQ